MLNISQGHAQKFLTKTFECNVNIKTTHYQAKEQEQEGIDVKESLQRGSKFRSGSFFRHGQICLNYEVLKISKAKFNEKKDENDRHIKNSCTHVMN